MSTSIAALRALIEQRFPDAIPLTQRTTEEVATGISELDGILPNGGLPRGRLSVWAPQGGATAILRAACDSAVANGERAAWIDGDNTVAGAFWSDELKLAPVAAKEIPTLENGLWKLLPGGKMQVTWHLKPSKWSDGVPVDAEDYVFTHRAVMNDKVPVIDRVVEKHIENIYAPAPDTIVVTYKDHFAYANTDVIEWGPWPRHLLEKAYHDNPGGLDKLPFGSDLPDADQIIISEFTIDTGKRII